MPNNLLQRIEELESMVSILKTENAQLRVENAQLKVDNAQLRVDNKRLKEENSELKDKITKFEFRLNKNSSNSSKPPSSDPPWKPNNKKTGSTNNKKGGQPGSKGSFKKLLPKESVSEFVKCLPEALCPCGGEIYVCSSDYERRQVFEIPKLAPTVTEYQLFKGVCQTCQKSTRGHLPIGAPSGMLGPNALATVGLLTGKYHLSKRDVEEFFSDYFSLNISLGTVSNAEQQVSSALRLPYEELVSSIKKEPVVGVDETGHKIAGKRGFMWVAISGLISVFFARSSRKKSVAQEILGEKFSGILISDRYGGYLWVSNRQLCWAHLIRDFQSLEDAGGEAKDFATPMLDYIREMFSLWHKYRDGELSREELQKQSKPIRKNIETALLEGQELLLPGPLCKGLCNLKNGLFTFIDNEGVEPTNNESERAIRQYVVWRKTSFGTQTSRGNEFVERILTVVTTCKKQERSVFEYLVEAMNAHLQKKAVPSLLPC